MTIEMTCTQCGDTKPQSAFPKVVDKRKGYNYVYYRGRCKDCVNKRYRAQRAGEDITGRRPCDTCYRIEQCKSEAYMCLAFEQWVEEAQFTKAFVGMREAIAA